MTVDQDIDLLQMDLLAVTLMSVLRIQMTVLRIAVIPWETILAPVLPATDWQVMVEGAMVSALVSAN